MHELIESTKLYFLSEQDKNINFFDNRDLISVLRFVLFIL